MCNQFLRFDFSLVILFVNATVFFVTGLYVLIPTYSKTIFFGILDKMIVQVRLVCLVKASVEFKSWEDENMI